MEKLDFSYDAMNDIMTIEGVRYAGAFFRKLGARGLSVGKYFQIMERKDGEITIRGLDIRG